MIRLPTDHERSVADVSEAMLRSAFENVPFGVPDEPTPKCGPGASRAFSVRNSLVHGFEAPELGAILGELTILAQELLAEFDQAGNSIA